MNPNTTNTKKYQKYLVILLICHTIAYIAFRFLNKGHQTWDSAGHIALAMKFTELFRSYFSDPSVSLYGILTASFYYPPLMHMIVGFLFLIFGKSALLALILMFLLFLLSIYLLYKLVLLLNFSPKIAFFTAFFYSLYPIVADQARVFHTEIPTFLVIILGCICLIKSEFLTKKRWVYLFFFFLGLGQMLKWVNAIFLFLPFLYVFYHATIVQKRLWNILPTLVYGALLFFILWLPWLFLNLRLFSLVGSWFAEGEIDDPRLFSPDNFLFYLRSLLRTSIFPVPIIGAIIGFFYFGKSHKKESLWFLVNFILIYFVFTFITNKNSRYVMGFFPVLAFLAAYGVDIIKNKIYSYILIFFTVLAFIFTGYNNVAPRSKAAKFWGIAIAGPFYGDMYIYPDFFSYSDYRAPVEEILALISKDAASLDIDPIGVAAFIDSKELSSSTMEMTRAQMDLTKVYFATPYYKKHPFDSEYDLLNYLSNKYVSYIIAPSGEVGFASLKHYIPLVQGRDFTHSQGNTWYEPIKTFDLPENQITIYRRNLMNKDFRVGTCRNFYQVPDGALTLPMDPMASLVFFTPSFEYAGIKRDYGTTTLQVLEINNPSMERELKLVTVTNLPAAGFTVCHRMGVETKVQKEFYLALVEAENSCGENRCEKLEHHKISDYSVEEKVYSFQDFLGGDPAGRLLKRIKILPMYTEIYTLENDIIKEFGDESESR